MKKILITTVSFFCMIATISAQNSAAKSVFAEIGGPGLASINYDMRFNKKEDGLGFRAGVGGFSIDDFNDRVTVLFFPLGINYLLGKDGRNYFEVGGGATLVSASAKNTTGTFTGTFGHLNLGYRLQPRNGGFTFRAAINPIFGQGGFIPYYAGISFGYKF